MKTDSTSCRDEALRRLFRSLPDEKPSSEFPSRVMAQVMRQAQHAARRNRIRRMAWMVAGTCLPMLLAMACFATRSYWMEDFLLFFTPLFASLSDAVSSISDLFADGSVHKIILPGIAALTLLLGDLFLRLEN
jgi:hypothetical protein